MGNSSSNDQSIISASNKIALFLNPKEDVSLHENVNLDVTDLDDEEMEIVNKELKYVHLKNPFKFYVELGTIVEINNVKWILINGNGLDFSPQEPNGMYLSICPKGTKCFDIKSNTDLILEKDHAVIFSENVSVIIPAKTALRRMPDNYQPFLKGRTISNKEEDIGLRLKENTEATIIPNDYEPARL